MQFDAKIECVQCIKWAKVELATNPPPPQQMALCSNFMLICAEPAFNLQYTDSIIVNEYWSPASWGIHSGCELQPFSYRFLGLYVRASTYKLTGPTWYSSIASCKQCNNKYTCHQHGLKCHKICTQLQVSVCSSPFSTLDHLFDLTLYIVQTLLKETLQSTTPAWT